MVLKSQKCIPLVGAKTALKCTGLQTTAVHGGQNREEKWNFRKFVSTYHHGTLFVPKQCLYQKEANGTESPKMCSTRWCKKRTYLHVRGIKLPRFMEGRIGPRMEICVDSCLPIAIWYRCQRNEWPSGVNVPRVTDSLGKIDSLYG